MKKKVAIVKVVCEFFFNTRDNWWLNWRNSVEFYDGYDPVRKMARLSGVIASVIIEINYSRFFLLFLLKFDSKSKGIFPFRNKN